MADIATTLPLIAESVQQVYDRIRHQVHRTPLLTSKTLDQLASSPRDGETGAPRFNIYFKCENFQRIGAFKARGAFSAVTHLIEVLGLEEVRRRGVVTHSSGNHAQALALAASEFAIPAHIVMPSISTPSKIAGTRAYTDNVRFSGSTAQERESVVAEVIRETGAVLVPPYDHPDIMLGQGTAALEMLEQYVGDYGKRPDDLKLVLTPCGGGGLLSGTAVFFSDKPTLVVGSEPSFQGADDAMRGLSAKPPKRVEVVKTLTIADGLRTPLGVLPFDLFASDAKSIENVYTVSEDEIKMAMRLVLERMKVFVEPSAVVPLAVVLYNTEFRRWARGQQGGEAWDIAVVLSGGNTTIESIIGLYGPPEGQTAGTARAESKIDEDGRATAENVAG